MNFPDTYYCPLTNMIMNDPVSAGDNYNYEKEAILNYVQKHGKSPITGQALQLDQIVANDELKQEIDSVRNQILDENRHRNLNLVKDSNIEQQQQQQHQQEEQKAQNEQVQVQTEDPSKVGLVISRFEETVKISIRTPVGTTRSACDICCVIDVSGSMSDEAKIKNEKGDIERDGLSILDLVKHSVKTIIDNLNENDRLSLVAFHTSAFRITELTSMNGKGKAEAIKELDKLIPLDSTNIWDGVYQGLEVMKEGQLKSKKEAIQRIAFSQILLFTDGQPNIVPPRGHLAMLKKYKEENDVNCSISTFGFGYNLDSELLDELAIEGRGSFAFIPDGQFVGTVFVNALSNLMTTLAVDTILCIENSNGTTFEDAVIQSQEEQTKLILPQEVVLGNYDYQRCSWGLNINIGSLQYGQTKDIVVRVKNIQNNNNKPYITATLKYKTSSTSEKVDEITKEFADRSQREADVLTDVFRLESVEAIRNAITLFKKKNIVEAQNIVKQQIQKMSSHPLSKSSKFVSSLIQDLTGQVTEALSTQAFYTKWGRHYLPSLLRAHQIQQCNNFKDPGVQNYGGQLFNQIRNSADEAFLKMPPPKPSIQKQQSYSQGGVQSAPKKINMRSYYNNSAPCFDGDCLVKMADGEFKKVKEIRKEDLISSPAINNNGARVVCVVRTPCLNDQAYFVQLEEGLIITPYHPIRVNNQWVFPCDLKATELRQCDFIYSFVLENGHSMEINGVECVTYAHNFQEDVVKHEYFGTERIIKDLSNMNGWNNGYVTLSSNCLVRDPITTLVIGLRENSKYNSIVSENQSTSLLI